MARPALTAVVQGVEGWDTIINDNFDKLVEAPFPVVQHTGTTTTLEAAFAAADYEDCLVMLNNQLYFSNGTTWAAV